MSMICPHCGAQADRKFCSNCAAPLAPVSPGRKTKMSSGEQLALGCGITVAVLVVLVIILIAAPVSKDSDSTSSPFPIHIGQEAVLSSGRKDPLVADSEASFKEWVDAEIANDLHGKMALLAADRVWSGGVGTRVLILDYGHVGVVPIYKIRVLDGKYEGRSGWASTKQVTKP